MHFKDAIRSNDAQNCMCKENIIFRNTNETFKETKNKRLYWSDKQHNKLSVLQKVVKDCDQQISSRVSNPVAFSTDR